MNKKVLILKLLRNTALCSKAGARGRASGNKALELLMCLRCQRLIVIGIGRSIRSGFSGFRV